MTVLAQLPEIIGFFSYSREDDLDSDGALSTLRKRIQSELRGQLGRSEATLRLFQDAEAIAPGTLWETQLSDAILKCIFFIPIVTPRVVLSKYCRREFESFLTREKAIGRSDLIFPIIYIEIPELKIERYWREDPVLKCIGERQYVDWSDHRFELDTPRARREIAVFARTIVHALKREPTAQLGKYGVAEKLPSKQSGPGAERITHGRKLEQAQESDRRSQALNREEEARGAGEEKSQFEVSIVEHRAVAKTWGTLEGRVSSLDGQRSSQRSTRARLIGLFIAATATMSILVGGPTYTLLRRSADQSEARSEADTEPKAVYHKSVGPTVEKPRQGLAGQNLSTAGTGAKAALEKAAGVGDTEAMIKLGWMYQNGLEVIQDYERAKQYYRQAVDLGDAEALNYLGSIYEDGLGVVMDYNQARSLYERAANAGNATGFRNLGLLYALGKGVSQDYDRARSFFERAKSLYQEDADKGNPAAITNLGSLYESGRGVGLNYDKAKSLYEKAALAGDAQAMNNLGRMYENARGTWQDYSKARSMYERAAAAGNQNAVSNLERLKGLEKLTSAR